MLLWTLAVAAAVSSFIVHLALRGRTVDLGFRLGKARVEQGRLREVRRVLELEAASNQTPERVEMVARTLLGMTPPPPEKVIPVRLLPGKPAAKSVAQQGNTQPGNTQPGKTQPGKTP
jgi:hypothetical protein